MNLGESAAEERAERAARKAERQAAKQRLTEERRLQRLQAAEAREEAERREREALCDRAYRNYLRVRDWARRASTSGRGGSPLTAVEQEMAVALAPLWDATPEVVTTLRRWSEPITAVRAADYDSPPIELVRRLKNAVATLRRHAGADLFVQESPLLGGFGIEWHRQSYNEDTVRYFKALVALQDGGVLGACRGGPRHLVWEIGGGWGGFAFQFKTVCPNVTYLITGIPELLLVSAVYLMTAFPAARCRFHGESSDTELWSDWQEIDFVFAPAGAVADLHSPPPLAALDLMALRHMDDARVDLHVQRAFDLGARYLFSQASGPCFPDPPPAVWRSIARRYWLHEIPPPLDIGAFYVDDFYKAPVIEDYAQVVGWRRLRA